VRGSIQRFHLQRGGRMGGMAGALNLPAAPVRNSLPRPAGPQRLFRARFEQLADPVHCCARAA